MSASRASMNLARQIVALEAAHGRTSRTKNSRGEAVPALQVCEKLRIVLTVFAGAAGFQALLTRAMTLAKAQAKSLAALQIQEDGSLAGFDKLDAETSREKGAAGAVLVAHLLDLLVMFIGESLTLQLVLDAWPDAPASALRARIEDTKTP